MSAPQFGRRSSTCPNCGAAVEFLWSSSIQTVCTYCRSILLRTDVDLRRVGVVADLPPDSSPIQLRADGRYGGKPFSVTGRILYAYEQGGWNEWHLVFGDGTSGWLSDAQSEYAVSFQTPAPAPLPAAEAIRVGQCFRWAGTEYMVACLTRAHYVGVEGELPFAYWDKEEVLFVDLRADAGRFATIDYGDEPPLLFTGECVELAALRMQGLREFEGW